MLTRARKNISNRVSVTRQLTLCIAGVMILATLTVACSQSSGIALRESAPTEILRPEREWEGAKLEIAPSRRGYIDVRVNQMRDPAIYKEGDDIFLLYSVAGESGIAIAELSF